MPKKPTEMERIILANGWIFKTQVGSHRQYIHPLLTNYINGGISCYLFTLLVFFKKTPDIP